MSEEIQVVQVGAAGAALAQASAALALQYKDETATLKGQVDTAKTSVDVAKAAVDTAKGQVDTAKAAVDVAKAAVDLSQADVIARQAVVVAAQATTEAARDVAVEQASEATEKAAEAAGNASLALAIFGTADNLNAAQQIMLGYANTAQAQAGLAASSAASASSVPQQDLSGVTAAALHRSPNAVTAMCVYDTSKDSDGGAWVERCTATSWFQEALNGTYLPGGFASEMDARDYLGSYQAASIVTGDSGNFVGSVGSWVNANANASVTSPTPGRMRVTLLGTLGTLAIASVPMTTVIGQRYQIAIGFATNSSGGQNAFVSAGTAIANNSLGSLNLTVVLGTRYLSFVATGTTTWLNFYGSTAWATGSYAELSFALVKPVTFANPAGAFYQLNTDGKFYRLWKNRLAYYDDFTNAIWGKTQILSTTANADGVGDLVVPNTTPASHSIQQVTGVAGWPSGTFTIRAKAGGYNYIVINVGNTANVWFNVNTGSVGTNASGLTATCVPAADAPGYFDCTVVQPAAATATTTVVYIAPADGGSTFFTPDGVSGVYFARAQHEYGPFTGWEAKTGADAGVTEVFRGNKAKPGRLSTPICDGFRATIYDLTEPGRPQWMTFVSDAANMARGTIASVAMLNGWLVLATNNGVAIINLAGDYAELYTTSGRFRYRGRISQRNAMLGWDTISTASPYSLANATINTVAMYVRPNAPIDPVTGLQIPIIAVAYGSGNAGNVGAVIMEDGTVVRYGQASNDGHSVAFTKRGDISWGVTGSSNLYVMPVAAANVTTISSVARTYTVATAPRIGTASNLKRPVQMNDVLAVWGTNTGTNSFSLLRENTSTPGAGLAATIADTYNTGWMAGDVRRVWCADTVTGVAGVGGEVLTSVDFTTGWTDITAPVKTNTSITVAAAGGVYKGGLLTVGRGYQFVLDVTVTGGSIFGLQNSQGASIPTLLPGGVSNGTGVYTGSFVASDTGLYFRLGAAGSVTVNSIAIREATADRCYKARHPTIYGTLARTAVASAAQLVAYSGFSGSNYIQEPYSADLDFGTGAWTCSAWVTIPTTLPIANFPEVGGELVSNGDFASDTVWVKGVGWTISSGVAAHAVGTSSGITQNVATSGRVYKTGWTVSGSTAGSTWPTSGGAAGTPIASGNGSYVGVILATTTGIGINGNAAFDGSIDNVSIKEVGPAVIAQRAHSSGPNIVLGVDAVGRLTATAFDGTTTRTVTTTAAYNTGARIKARVSYTTDGTLSISVNGRVVASTYGTPLLTMNNASAVTTIGNSRTLDAPSPGDICLVKWGASVPSAEAMLWMYEQEKAMFRAGAQVTLPDTGSLVDVAYDDLTDTVTTVSAANEAHFNGLVRTSTAAVPAGAFTKAARGSGVKLLARSTTNIGVDVTIPSQNLREQLLRADDAARRARLPATFDYVGGFTANTTNGSTALASVSGLSVPAGVNLRGVTVTGTGIPGSTVITDIVGSTVYISKPATATNTGVSISMLDFPLPVGYEAEGVAAAGALKQEGATKDWTRSFDGFVERTVFGAAPGATAWVQTRARRAA